MKNYRREKYSTPEDATAYRGIYLDCSSYVNSIYYNLIKDSYYYSPPHYYLDNSYYYF